MEGMQCLRGINLVTTEFSSDYIRFSFKNEQLFKVPFEKIQNSQIINKNDVTIEFPYDDAEPNDDTLCEMRLAFSTKIDEKDKEERKPQNGEITQTPAEIFNGKLMARAKIAENAGESIVTLLDLPLVLPRGKYSCDMYRSSLRLHGASYNFIVQYKHIIRAFLLPKPDDVNMIFVLGLEKPMRQGSTSYPYIIMQFKKDLEDSITPRLKREELKDSFPDLQDTYEGPFYEIVVKIFKAMVGINIIIPGTEKNPGWKSTKGQSAVKCSVKANEGHLYFLQKSLLFINKPVIYVKIEEIARADFQRISSTSAQSKMFDLEVVLKNGQTHAFVGIEKKEFQSIVEFFQQKKIAAKMTEDPANKLGLSEGSDDYEDEDDENQENKGRKKAKKKATVAERDDDEEDDEDFVANDDEESEDDDDEFNDEDDDDARPKQKNNKK